MNDAFAGVCEDLRGGHEGLLLWGGIEVASWLRLARPLTLALTLALTLILTPALGRAPELDI